MKQAELQVRAQLLARNGATIVEVILKSFYFQVCSFFVLMVPMKHSAQLPSLKSHRVHEVCGSAALSFALMMAAQKQGAVVFVDLEHKLEQIHPFGAACILDVSRILLVRAKTHTDVLWIAEEALRSGCVSVVITRVGQEIDLTSGRRLQLAAEAGKALGLFIVPEGMGSNAAETRWHCMPTNARSSPLPAQMDSTLYLWECIKNKTGTTGNWAVRWNEETHHIDYLSQISDGPLSQTESS